ncbi:histidine phosphatase family protein [Streptomyces sp. NPDC001070]
MTVQLTLLSAPARDATRDTAFGDGLLSARDRHDAGATPARFISYSVIWRAPSIRCAQTADALGVKATLEPALRDFDYGTWRERTVGEIAETDPDGLSAWLTDPDAAPHGGESVRRLCRRAANWLNSLPPGTGPALAIAEPTFIRALLVHAMSTPARAFWHFDVPPLSTVSFTSRGDGWQVRRSPAVRGAEVGRFLPPREPSLVLDDAPDLKAGRSVHTPPREESRRSASSLHTA